MSLLFCFRNFSSEHDLKQLWCRWCKSYVTLARLVAFLDVLSNSKPLSGFDMLCCLHQWTLYFVSDCEYIGFCCVQISDKAILLFFVLLFCMKDKCLPIVITWWVDRWKQYSYCSTICSWIFTDLELRKKVNWLLKNAN